MKVQHIFISNLIKVILFIGLEILCCIAISNNSIIQKFIILEKVRGFQIFLWGQSTSIKNYFNLRKTNENLANENLQLMEILNNNRERLYKVNEENIYNATMNINKDSLYSLHIKERPEFSFIPAKIIKNSYGTLHNYIIINKGSNDGITEDMGVITPSGVVGIVRAVGKNNSYVHSFFNIKQNVSTKIGNTDAFGPMVWDQISMNYATLNEIPQHIKFNIGDTVYTSGMSAFYPPDIPLGTIEKSRVFNGVHHSIDVKLFQNPRILNFVVVVKNNNKSEIDSLSRFSDK